MNYIKRYHADCDQIKAIVEKAFEEMVEHLRVKLDVPSWNPKLGISFSQHRRRSWGGIRHNRPFISMNLFGWIGFKRGEYREYASFKSDPVIGGIKNCTREQGLRGLVAHELAHAAQYSIITGIKGSKCFAHGGSNDRGHGSLWKTIYRDLRVNFVNGESKMETSVVSQPKLVTKPERKKKITNRARAFEIISSNPGKTKSEFVTMVMEALQVSKANAYTYVYHARKAQVNDSF